jgi:hypothetical protein
LEKLLDEKFGKMDIELLLQKSSTKEYGAAGIVDSKLLPQYRYFK